MNEITKGIAYAFPGSPNAHTLSQLGDDPKGCWHVSLTIRDIEGSGQSQTFLPHDAEGFDTPDDPDLISLFTEYEGTTDRSFARYGNAAALSALGLLS